MNNSFVQSKLNLALVLFLATGCASLGLSEKKMKFAEAVTLVNLDGRETSIPAGQTTEIPSEPVKIEAPGMVSLLVVPLDSNTSNVDIKMRKLEGWSGPDMGRQVNIRLNQILEKVVEAQKALGSKRGREALSIIESIQKDSPELTFLNFLKASAHVLNGDRSAAIASLEVALATFPDNASGKALLKSLKGSP